MQLFVPVSVPLYSDVQAMPRFVLAAAAVVPPVPPLARATVPVTLDALPLKLPLVLMYRLMVVFVPASKFASVP